jgi:sec-independent protein translocase protein TatA
MAYIILALGGSEIVLVFLIFLLLFGSNKIPELAKGIGKGLREFKKATDDIKREISDSTNGITKDISESADAIRRNITDITSDITTDITKTTSEINQNLNNITNDYTADTYYNDSGLYQPSTELPDNVVAETVDPAVEEKKDVTETEGSGV